MREVVVYLPATADARWAANEAARRMDLERD